MDVEKQEFDTNKKGFVFKCYRELGKGGFGTVYETVVVGSRGTYALKLENKENFEYSTLEKEYKILKTLKNKKGIPSVYKYGVNNRKRYILMELLGNSLQEMIKTYKKNLEIVVVEIAINLLLILRNVHTNGYV